MNVNRSRFTATLALLLLAGCGGGEDVTPRNLAEARAKWEAAGPADYDLEWTSSGARRGHYLVAVRGGEVRSVESVLPDGEVIAARPGDPSFYGVEGLFRVLEEEASQLLEDRPFGEPKGSRILLKFDPDPRLGYPRSYRRDVVGSREALTIDVVRLDPVAVPSQGDNMDAITPEGDTERSASP